MALINCPECKEKISENAVSCPKCGNPMKQQAFPSMHFGIDWKSKKEIRGWPLLHIAFGFDVENGKLRIRVARGIIAIGQFGVGVITIAQFGIGLLFGMGQFIIASVALGQFALGLLFGLGQFATGLKANGQFTIEYYKILGMSA